MAIEAKDHREVVGSVKNWGVHIFGETSHCVGPAHWDYVERNFFKSGIFKSLSFKKLELWVFMETFLNFRYWQQIAKS